MNVTVNNYGFGKASLTTLLINGKNGTYTFNNEAFRGSSITELVLGEGSTYTFNSGCFSATNNLTKFDASADNLSLTVAADVFSGKSALVYVDFSGENSTYVFKDRAFNETNPINVYGESKLAGEKAVSKCEKHYIVRTSWLYGHHGKNFVETMLSLKDKEVLKVVDDQIGCPTWTVELANGIVEILDEELDYGIYQVCGSGSTSWYNFAKKIFELSDLEVNLKPCSTDEFPRPAKRPSNSIMDNEDFCRNWEIALKEYLELRCEWKG